MAKNSSNTIVKFAYDTTVVGPISNKDERANLEEPQMNGEPHQWRGWAASEDLTWIMLLVAKEERGRLQRLNVSEEIQGLTQSPESFPLGYHLERCFSTSGS